MIHVHNVGKRDTGKMNVHMKDIVLSSNHNLQGRICPRVILVRV